MGDFAETEVILKAIETVYKGYRFRSRLEARWAVFFDRMGIRYEYEPEGFEINHGDGAKTMYLPDFYFPGSGLYGEVKGTDRRGGIPEEDAEKMSWMIDYDGPCSKGIVLFGNIPYCPSPVGIGWAVWYWNGKGISFGYLHDWYFSLNDDVEDLPGLVDVIDSGSAPMSFDEKDDIRLTYTWAQDWMDDLGPHVNEKLLNALTAARQARFEHGEAPHA